MISKNSDNMSSAKLDQGLTNSKQESNKKTPSHNGKNGKKPTSSNQNNKTDDTPKMTLGVIEEYLSRFFKEGQLQPLMPKWLKYKPFNVLFYQEDSESGVRQVIVDKESGTARVVGFEELTSILHDHLSVFAIEDNICNKYCLSHVQLRNFAKRLQAVGNRIEKWPEPCGFKSQPGIFFERLPFDPVTPSNSPFSDFPLIASMLERMTNSKAFCKKVGALFDMNADRKQAVVLYGDGDGGKSAIFNMLKYLSGQKGYAPITEDVSTKDFSLWPLVDKRLWIGEEIKPLFFRGNTFKRLTGGAPLMINPKGEKQFAASMCGMLFANSNDRISIPNDSGLKNRLIICHVKTIPKEDRIPEHELMPMIYRELPYFVGYCMDLSDGKRVDPEDSFELDQAIEEIELPYQMLFDEYFVYDPIMDFKDCDVRNCDLEEALGDWIERSPATRRNLNIDSLRKYIKNLTGNNSSEFAKQRRYRKDEINLNGKVKDRFIVGIKKRKKRYSSL